MAKHSLFMITSTLSSGTMSVEGPLCSVGLSENCGMTGLRAALVLLEAGRARFRLFTVAAVVVVVEPPFAFIVACDDAEGMEANAAPLFRLLLVTSLDAV